MDSGVRLRPARAQDLPDIAELIAQAMLEDELYTWLCPGRYEHYADFRNAFLRRLKKRFVTVGYVMVVAVEHSGDREQICGYSVWERLGAGTDAERWQSENNGWWHALERKLLDIEDRYLSLVSPDRSVDSSSLQHYRKATAVATFPFPAFPELWYLGQLAVDPAHQRRGIGRQLVEWGLQQAQLEHVCVGLEAGSKGAGLYEKIGFQLVNTKELTTGVTIRAMLYTISVPMAA